MAPKGHKTFFSKASTFPFFKKIDLLYLKKELNEIYLKRKDNIFVLSLFVYGNDIFFFFKKINKFLFLF